VAKVKTYKEQIDAFVIDAVKIINECNGLEAAAEFLPSVFLTANELSKTYNKEQKEVLNDLAEATRLELYGE
jgi:hypothetical protein